MQQPYTVQVWGIVSFIGIRFATTFKLIFEIISTLSFYIDIHRTGDDTVINLEIINFKIILL